jgi:general secretion pathway protein D
MTFRPTRLARMRSILAAFLVTLLAACASMPPPTIHRDGAARAQAEAQQAQNAKQDSAPRDIRKDTQDDGAPRPQIHRGSGRTINPVAAASPPPSLGGTTGEATFNFEGESLQAVVKAILGDMLGQNYVIAPGVQGTVTLATPKKVSPAEALSLLEMVLGWNNARMVYSDGRYNIVPADQALATGVVAPRTGSAISARGFESRVVPLRYVSATEMEKILKPYARVGAVVNVDSGRNIITVAGTRSELENYLRTIQIFDVDWMSSMSVGVFPLQNGKANKVVADLEKVFGEQGKSPVAGMFRFMPLEGANAVLVITPQAEYLNQIQQWLDRIDGAGAGVQLFSYELKYVKAKDLADRLAEVFGGGSGGGSDDGGGNGASLMPGLDPTEIRDGGVDSNSNVGTASIGNGGASGTGDGGSGGSGESSLSLNPRRGGNGSVTLQVAGERVGVAAVDETNTLLVRTTGTAWKSIRDVVEKLDVMPLQVHIEAQIAQVTLSGDLTYGVNWYFENAIGTRVLPATVGIRTLTNAVGANYTFLVGNSVAFLSALDAVTDVKMLQTPSVFVRNNSEASFNVGTNIPIASVSFNPTTGTSDGTFSQVQYLQTGTILKVRPRITKDGIVFLDLVQEISTPGSVPANCTNNCNPPIDTRKLKTEAAVRSGDTVLLAGLIDDGTTRSSAGFPGLSRIPVIGGLFGQQKSKTTRNETIILLTPTIVRSAEEAVDLTEEYSRRFRAMEPIKGKKK